MTPERGKTIITISGIGFITLVMISMVIRGVDPAEVLATIMFAPLLLAILYFGFRGGLVFAAISAAMYVALRWRAIQLVGLAPISGLLLARVAGFFAFGVIGGWASDVVGDSLRKLALFDEIDDATGLHNARSLVAVLDRERNRAGRYAAVFSVVDATFDPPSGSARSTRSAFRVLGTLLAKSVRLSDHISHLETTRNHVVVVLPETGAEGAATVAANLKTVLTEWHASGIDIETLTTPDDLNRLDELAAMAKSLVPAPPESA